MNVKNFTIPHTAIFVRGIRTIRILIVDDSSCCNLLIIYDNVYCMLLYMTARCPFPPLPQVKHYQRQQLLPVTELPKLLHFPNIYTLLIPRVCTCLHHFTPISASECSKNWLVKQGVQSNSHS